ncbi:cold-shock protein [Roseateles violae]|uniref:Cold shock domain-containing protein n=1 Tax=Roseateles violae TaxID=3058042 RepID=A0ABT8DX42_9BURK|nr:cold shock domain-containing protein [Pelomonas sp. PFR6]MDN3921197.1 cold shock domain-containing protein [Pelomonas sp. PFR6]
MRFEGTLTEWNPDRGYGAVASIQGGEPLFVHISAFPTDGAAPTLGEALSFEVVSGRDGRKKAHRVQRSKRLVADPVQLRLAEPTPRRRRIEQQQQRRRRMTTAILLSGLLLCLGLLGWMHLTQPNGAVMALRASGITLR